MQTKYCPFFDGKCNGENCAIYCNGKCALAFHFEMAKELKSIKKVVREMALQQGCEVEMEDENNK